MLVIIGGRKRKTGKKKGRLVYLMWETSKFPVERFLNFYQAQAKAQSHDVRVRIENIGIKKGDRHS